jgi:DNA-binding SARP family transcriptional activator
VTGRRNRARYWIRLLGLLAAEGAVLGLLLTLGSALGSVGWSNPAQWLSRSDPTSVLTALVRAALIALLAWMVLTTALYGLSGATTRHSSVRRKPWAGWTFPFLRRVIDGAAAVSVMVSAVTSSATSPAAASTVKGQIVEQSAPGVGAAPGGRQAGPVQTDRPSAVAAAVSPSAIGRHLPHPGLADHNAPGRSGVAVLLPGNAAANSVSLAEGSRFYVVQPGDCLSVIAERHLGDWRRDAEIDQLNRGRMQPDGRALVDDHWIYPGWVLVMPADAVDVQVTGPPAAEVAAPLTATVTAPPATQVAAPPTAQVAALPTSESTSSPALGATQVTTSVEHSDDAVRLVEAGVGLLVAGAIGFALRRRRREAMHDRPSGRRVRRNRRAVENAESLARAKGGDDAAALMRRVDLALQVLGRELLERNEGSVPAVALVRAAADGIEIMVDPPTEAAPLHFEAVEAGRVWVLDPSLTTQELEALAEPCWPFLPALVTVGETPDGTVLVNLEHAGVLRVTGDPDMVAAVLAETALELRCQPWSGENVGSLIVNAVGIEAAGTLSEALTESARRSANRCGAAIGEAPSAAIRRAASLQWPPTVAVCGRATDPCLLEQLCAAARPDRSALVVVTAVEGESGWSLDLDADGSAVMTGELNRSTFTLALRREANGPLLEQLEEALGRPLGEPPPAWGEPPPAWGEPPPAWGGPPDQGGAGLPDLVGTVELPNLDAWIAEVEGEWEDETMAGEDEDDAEGEARVVAFRSGQAGEVEVTIDLLGEPTHRGGEAVELTILGPVGLEGNANLSAVPSSRRASALAVICFLATRSRPVPADEIAAALWPVDSGKDNFGEPRRKTIMNVISRARALLGEPLAGPSRLVLTERGYALSGEVACDWTRFQQQVDGPAGSPAEEAAVLRSALELVKGPPLAGSLSGPFFEWVSAQHLDLAIEAKVVDSAERLGHLALELGDAPTAEWAIRKGLDLDPAREELYRLWMHVAGRAGRPDQVDEIYRRLCQALQRYLDAGMAPTPASDRVRASYSSRIIHA